jgi:spore coat protein CotH
MSFAFRAVAALTLVGPTAVTAQTAPTLFDDTHVHDIWLTVDPVDWATLRRDYQLNTYYPAQFTFNEHNLGRVGIRSRGSGSRSPEKPNLLVSFDRYEKGQELLGLPAVILKANNQDPSLLREILSMSLLRKMNVPAPREAPARLHINGEEFGAYTLVERIDSAFLTDRFGQSDGYLYEWEARRTEQGYRFEYLGPDPASYSPELWSPSNNESNPDPGPIVELTDVINNASDSDFRQKLPEYLDVDNFLRFIATENFVADYDGILGTVFGMNNFYAYRFEQTKRHAFLAWDKDAAFDWEYKPIFEGVQENVLARRLMTVPEWRQKYLEYLTTAAQMAGGREGWLGSELERLYTLIRQSASADPHKQCGVGGVLVSCGAADFEAAVQHLRAFAAARSAFVIAEARNAGYVAPPR